MEKQGIYAKYTKRILDIFFSVFALIFLSPVLVITAVLVRTKLGSPVIFKQDRPGYREHIFKLYKFRTMTDKTDNDGNLLPDAERMTGFGRKLRQSSLDELPELINIIKGDMAIVGPRPLLCKYLSYYTKEEQKRHDVRPGLTGWAQIHGRNNVGNWEQRFSYDVEYVEKISFLMDIKIIFSTIFKVFKKEGVVDPGSQEDFDIYRQKQQENQPKEESMYE